MVVVEEVSCQMRTNASRCWPRNRLPTLLVTPLQKFGIPGDQRNPPTSSRHAAKVPNALMLDVVFADQIAACDAPPSRRYCRWCWWFRQHGQSILDTKIGHRANVAGLG